MELLLFLSLAVAPEFSVTFRRSNASYQKYFQFDGNFTSARLFRAEDNLNLQFTHFEELSWYQYNCSSSQFKFDWPHFIDGEPMVLIQGETELQHHSYRNYKLFDADPIIAPTVFGDKSSQSEIIYQFIMTLLLIVLLIIESPGKIRQVLSSWRGQHMAVQQV